MARGRKWTISQRAPVVAFAALWAVALSSCSQSSGGQPEADADTAAVPVVLHRVGPAVDGLIEAAGTVRLRRETPLAFVGDGRVQSVLVREGDRVAAGQRLASLDPTAIDAAAIAADSRANQATAELARQRALLQQGWVSRARVESAEAAARVAQADRTAARFTQRFATITAPADGIVLARLVEPGQTLPAGTPVILLGEFASGFVLRVPLSAADVAGLERGAPATVLFPGGAAAPMVARIIEIAGRADPRTGTFQVEFALPDDAALRSGQIADVRLPGSQGSASLMVPASALFAARADEGFVWRFDPATRTVTAAMVSIAAVTNRGVEVQSGLLRGDLVVAAGVDRLIEGQRVQPVQPKGSETSSASPPKASAAAAPAAR